MGYAYLTPSNQIKPERTNNQCLLSGRTSPYKFLPNASRWNHQTFYFIPISSVWLWGKLIERSVYKIISRWVRLEQLSYFTLHCFLWAPSQSWLLKQELLIMTRLEKVITIIVARELNARAYQWTPTIEGARNPRSVGVERKMAEMTKTRARIL